MTATSVRITGRPRAVARRERPLVLDPGRITERRRMLGLTTHALAGALGTTSGFIIRVESGGSQDVLDLGFVADLARVLGCPVAELLLAPGAHARADEAPPATDPAVAAETVTNDAVIDDAKVVGSAVAAAFGWIAVDDLCHSLGWALDRVLEALCVVETSAPAVGMRLAWFGDHVCLVPAHDEPGSLRGRGVRFHYSLQKDPAALLHRLARGDDQKMISRHAQISQRRLVALGLAEYTDVPSGPELRLTDDGRYNLCLDEGGTGSASTSQLLG